MGVSEYIKVSNYQILPSGPFCQTADQICADCQHGFRNQRSCGLFY